MRGKFGSIERLGDLFYRNTTGGYRDCIVSGFGERFTGTLALRPSYNYWRCQATCFSTTSQLFTQRFQSGTAACEQESQIGKQGIRFEVGRLANMADGSCLAQSGNTQVLATVVVAGRAEHVHRHQHLALPLQVEYRERPSAAGRLPFGSHRREGLTDYEHLSSAILERALGPHFPPGFFRTVQVSANVLSAGGDADPVILAINAASAALMCSSIPWAGPVGAVRVARSCGNLEATLSAKDTAKVDLTLLYAGLQNEAVLVDLQARQVQDEVAVAAVTLANQEVAKLLAAQISLARRTGRRKERFPLSGADPAAVERVMEGGRASVDSVLQDTTLPVCQAKRKLDLAKAELLSKLKTAGFFRLDALRVAGSGCVSPMDLEHAWSSLVSRVMRDRILEHNIRPDGRGLMDLRQTRHESSLLGAPHGSAASTAGHCQVLSTVALGHMRSNREADAQELERSNFFVHFSCPSPASNMVSPHPTRILSKSEQLTGAFVERALEQLLPSESVLPFGVRVNVDVLAADGSLAAMAVTNSGIALASTNISMAARVAGTSVALVSDARGPQVAGSTRAAAAGEVQRYVSKPHRWELMTDPQELEEAAADMLLTAAGTASGLLCIQMICSTQGVPLSVVEAAIRRAKEARSKQLEAIPAHSPEAAYSGPQFGSLEIAKEHIGRLIGPGGSVLRSLEESTGARIAVQESGTVQFFAPSREQFEAAEKEIGSITGNSVKAGEVYSVKVVRLLDYGAFVELPDGFQTLLHISELSHTRVRSVEDVLRVGMQLDVLCQGKDSRGFVKISRRALLEPKEARL